MKTKNGLQSIFLTIFLLAGIALSAQQGNIPGNRNCLERIPGLTDKQKEQIENARTEHLRKIQPMRNMLREKKARLHSLETVENADMAEINKTVEEIGDIRTRLQKERAAHRQAIRDLLTTNQKVHFDNVAGRYGKCRGRNSAMGQGKSNCPYSW